MREMDPIAQFIVLRKWGPSPLYVAIRSNGGGFCPDFMLFCRTVKICMEAREEFCVDMIQQFRFYLGREVSRLIRL